MLENGIRTIKFGCQFLTMVILEGIFFISLQSKKHLVSFCKLTFRAMLICMFLHVILGHDQILFEGTIISYQTVSVWSTAWTFETPGKYESTEGGFFPYTSSKGVMWVAIW
jgi:hypothetical protein